MSYYTNGKYYTHGKLMISGEYTVLRGAKALAIPTYGYGQNLEVIDTKTPYHLWESYEAYDDISGRWFQAKFSLDLQEIIETDNVEIAKNVQTALQFIQAKRKCLFEVPKQFTSLIDYDRKWGIGSSAGFLVNLQKWSGISAFVLNDEVFKKGSGYDIAVGLEDKPIIYWLDFDVEEGMVVTPRISYYQKSPQITWIEATPFINYSDEVWFVYRNKKQSTSEEIDNFKDIPTSDEIIDEITQITLDMEKAKDLKTFNKLIDRHETIMSNLLQRPSLKQSLFPDFEGSIKSLGAWGGDFFMATGSREKVKDYFSKKGYNTMFSSYDLFLNLVEINS